MLPMAGPLVSILIPCHNAGRWLAETLESALAQTWPHKEIIVVNDGSSDNSGEIAHAFASRGVQVIDQPQTGQSAAFNAAIRAARGGYYEFLDADDLLAADKIERQIVRLQELPDGWVATCRWARFRDQPADPPPSPGPLAEDLPPVEWLVRLWSSDWMMHGATWLVPADVVRKAGGWNERLSLINDFEFFARVVLASAGVAYCPEALTYYRSGLIGSLSNRRSPEAWQSALESVRIGTGHLLAREGSPKSRAACQQAWRNLVFDSFIDSPSVSREATQRLWELGGTTGLPQGTAWFRFTARVFGWKAAVRLRHLARNLCQK